MFNRDPLQLDPSLCKGCAFLGFGSASTVPNSDFALLSHTWFHSPADRIPRSALPIKKGHVPSFRCLYCKAHDAFPSLDEHLSGKAGEGAEKLQLFLLTPVSNPSSNWHPFLCWWVMKCAPQEQKHLLLFQATRSAAEENMVVIYVHINEMMHFKIYQNKRSFPFFFLKRKYIVDQSLINLGNPVACMCRLILMIILFLLAI